MRVEEICELKYRIGMLSILLLFREYGRNDAFGELLEMYRGEEIHEDSLWEIYWEAICKTVECVNVRFIESEDCDEHFISDETLTEYYRLCKAYGRRHGVSFKENPWVKKADAAVAGHMNGIESYGYRWRLSTGTNHKYASALHYFQYPDFCQPVQAIESILGVMDFYHREIRALRKELYPEIRRPPKCKKQKSKAKERQAA
jgi:hypothetical protein